MYDSVVPSPLLNDRTTTGPSLSVHHQGRNGSEYDPAAVIPSGPPEETVPAWTQDVINPPSQEALGATSVFNDGLDIYRSYSVSYFDQGVPPTVPGFVSQAMNQPLLPYPVEQTANALVDDGPFGFLPEMECQSVPEMISADQSPSGPLSALDLDEPTVWSGPGHTPPVSDHRDHSSFRPSADLLEAASSHLSIESAPDDGEAIRKLGPANGDLNLTPELGTATPFSPSQQDMPTGWVKIPQRNYDHSQINTFPQWEKITFSVNNTPGFNLQDALCQVFTGLAGRDDSVLQGAKGPVSCRLLFPGYPMDPSKNQIPVQNWKKEREPIIKSKLAHEIAKRIERYLKSLTAISIGPSVDARWTIGQGFMTLERMHLVSVVQVSRGSLQPEIWVDCS